jgi:ABC-type multidrug transport system fused ATPase/permease subunit
MAGPRQDRDIPKAKINKESIKDILFIFSFLKPYKKYFIGGLIFISLSALSTMAFPFLMGKMIDAVSGGKNSMIEMANQGNGFFNKFSFKDKQWPLNTVLLLIFIQLGIQTIFSFMRVYLLTKSGTHATADLRTKLYAKLIALPMSFYSSRRVGDLSSRVAADTGQIQDTVSFVFAEFLRGIITLFIGLSLIFFISWKLALIMLSIVPLIAISAVVFGSKIRKLSKQETDMLADSSTVVQETLQGIAVVKAFTAESTENKRYSTIIHRLVDFAIKSGTYRGVFVSFIIFSVFGAISFVVWYGAGMVQTGELQVGELMSFVIYSVFVGGTLGGFADMFGQLQKTIGATQRVKELFYLDAENIESSNYTKNIEGNVIFKDVHFSYESRKDVEVLQGLSFEVKSGQQVAIVGGSGGGKTTIASLIMRFYDINTGQILIDDKPLNTYTIKDIRSQIAYVPQDVTLFGGTIYENILYGKPEASETEVIEAAKKANAYDFIDSFPDQFKTIVGERGIQLSGGQKQRIAIARALIKNPSILLLDEATSALDSESEKLVQQALDELMKNRTSIVIAHRLSTIINADKIIVMDKGKIVEQGTHSELVQQSSGYYKNLYALQLN